MDGKHDAEDKLSISTSNDGPSQSNEGTTQKKRRAKGDSGDRNYTCGCGKSYLSYPALYTHIKTKHDSVTPAGTSQPNSNGKSGRGRPKKEDTAQKLKEEEKGESSNWFSELQFANEQMINFLRTLGPSNRYDNIDNKDNGSVYAIDQEGLDLIAEFPVQILKDASDYEPVLSELKLMVKSGQIPNDETDRDTELKKTNLNKILAVFIFSFGKQLKKDFYKELVFFLMMYRKALNELGWNKKYEQTRITEKGGEFCALNNGEYAPDISNDFITDKWPEYYQQYPIIKFKTLGTDVESIKNTVFLTQNFCNWLNNARYTNSRLTISNDDGTN